MEITLADAGVNSASFVCYVNLNVKIHDVDTEIETNISLNKIEGGDYEVEYFEILNEDADFTRKETDMLENKAKEFAIAKIKNQ